LFEIYKNKKVLITGHTGFKGSWLTVWLLKLGAHVSGYALDPRSEKDNFVLARLENKIDDYRYDVRDINKLNEIVTKENPEIIFHMAAQPLVLESYDNPYITIETNTHGTANILEVFRLSSSAKVLIVITTDKVYKNNEWEWGYRENDVLGGKDPYSASKAAAELLIYSYHKSYIENDNTKFIASVRAGNVIGGGDWAENRIVPDCIKAIESNKIIKIRNPLATRPWQHVLEPLSGYLSLGEKLLNEEKGYEGAWNFGPTIENNKTVEELVVELISNYGSGTFEKTNTKNAPKEAKFLYLDISKAANKLHWKPLLNFKDTIRLTTAWYKNYNLEEVFTLCNKQIEQYEILWKLKNGK